MKEGQRRKEKRKEKRKRKGKEEKAREGERGVPVTGWAADRGQQTEGVRTGAFEEGAARPQGWGQARSPARPGGRRQQHERPGNPEEEF